jgi:hypothetical protein
MTSGQFCPRLAETSADDDFFGATASIVTVSAPQPPTDPESWTDEQWLTWLKATDDAEVDGAPPATVAFRVTHSAGGQALGDAMRGLASAMYGPKDEDVIIVSEAGGQPQDDEPFVVHLDREHPERSTAVFTIKDSDH